VITIPVVRGGVSPMFAFIPIEFVWLAVAFAMVMAGMLAAAAG
jgi:hypothetical protein